MPRRRLHEPRVADKFWDGARRDKGLQANGYILRVHKDRGEVTEVVVKFLDSSPGNSFGTYYTSDFDGFYRNETLGYVING